MQKWAQVAEESGSMGTPESSMPSDAFRTGAHATLARTPHWRQSVFGIPKQTGIVTSKVPRL